MADGTDTDTDTDGIEERIEREKNESFELGHISQLRSLGEEFRERAGEMWAGADSRTGVETARKLKNLARELEARADERREKWDRKYGGSDDG